MTDQELAQAVSDRINAAEAAAEAAGDIKRLRQIKRAHALLDRAHKLLMVMGDVQPLSGGGPKPPETL